MEDDDTLENGPSFMSELDRETPADIRNKLDLVKAGTGVSIEDNKGRHLGAEAGDLRGEQNHKSRASGVVKSWVNSPLFSQQLEWRRRVKVLVMWRLTSFGEYQITK